MLDTFDSETRVHLRTLIDQLASETGAKVVANLYDDSVGDPPADSYVGVLTWDTDQLVAALR